MSHFYVAFCGYARAGKTSTANYLYQYFRENDYPHTTIFPMAGPMKNGLLSMGIGKDDEDYRDICQFIGARKRRSKPLYWIDLHEKQLKGQPDKSIVIIDDIRYPNELDYVINKQNYILVFIDASKRLDVSHPLYTHESEVLAKQITTDNFAYMDQGFEVVDNNGSKLADCKPTLEMLATKVNYVIKSKQTTN